MRRCVLFAVALAACQGADKVSDGPSGGASTNVGGSSTHISVSGGGTSANLSDRFTFGGAANLANSVATGGATAPMEAHLGGAWTSSPRSGGAGASGGARTTSSAPATGGVAVQGTARSGTTPTGGAHTTSAASATGNASAGGVSPISGTTASAALGPYPVESSTKTRGGTMTFTNVGAAGWWPRRIDRPSGEPACSYKDGTDTWGGHCCMREQHTESTTLAPFDEELTLILKAINVKQLAVYQPTSTGSTASWGRATSWDARSRKSENLWFTQQGAGSTTFLGDLTQNDCVSYVMQEPRFDCGDGRDYFCPNDAGIMHRGYSGSKLVVLLASMTFSDASVKACSGTGTAQPAPWVAFVASELVRDGGRKWNGLCNCYSKTGTVGDGCGEINVFEVVMDNNSYSNREFASTGVRSYQAGHIGGAVAGASLAPSTFAADSEVVDACAKAAYSRGPSLVAGGSTDGCPIWRRPNGDRFFFILLDESTRTIQVGIIHPENVPSAASELLPNLPPGVSRSTIDAMIQLRLPG